MQAPVGPIIHSHFQLVFWLMNAAEAGNIDSVRELLGEDGVGVNDADEGGFTALYCASQEGRS